MDLTFRAAIAADAAAIRAVMGREPSDEQVGMAGGDAEKAARFRVLAAGAIAGKGGLQRTTVAVAEGEVVGFVQSGAEGGEGITPALAWGVLRIFGPFGIRGFLRRDRARARVSIPAPAGAFHLAELHVSARRRNAGIGAALLAEAERQARAAGFTQMSLTTTTSNPARRLYERSGFTIVQTATDPEYVALTGVEGRILMVKPLA
ncbi:MAG: GNAT family N-acetyltransferase [Chloroflexi bacterium]|nr:GNAT family N-acetyltransferase [Chloroflexota bacterium]